MLRTRPAGRRRSGTDCWRRARTREWDRTPRPVHVARFPGLLATGSSSTPRLALYPAHPTPRDQQGAPEAAGLLSGRGLSPRPGRPVVRRGRRHRRPGGTRLRRRARATRQRLDARDLRRAPRLFLEAGRLIVELCKRWYAVNGTGGESGQSGQNGADGGDALVLPRSTLTKAALSNAMRMDIAMGAGRTRSCTCWPPPRRRRWTSIRRHRCAVAVTPCTRRRCGRDSTSGTSAAGK